MTELVERDRYNREAEDPEGKATCKMAGKKWITPFQRQCFVTTGVSLNIGSHGLTVSFVAILLPQLRRPDSGIIIDDSSGSWISAAIGITLLIGNLIVPTIMGKFGRKIAMIISIVLMIIGWIGISLAESIPVLILARLFQGLSMGLGGSPCPILIGECTSPRNRGAFLATISLSIALSVFTVHTLGSYLTYQTTSLVCAFISVIDLAVVVFSPESPTWLADQARYEECKQVFRWLRGNDEDEELYKMIEDRKLAERARKLFATESLLMKFRRNMKYFWETIRKKEFYKPIWLMIHVYALGMTCGAIILVSYTVDIFQNLVGDIDIAAMLMILDLQRIISNIAAIFIIKKVKRRTILFGTGAITLFGFGISAIYTYLKKLELLPFDHPSIGILLIHLLMFSVAIGPLPLIFIFAGELYPLEYKSLASGIGMIFYSISLFLVLKTFPFLLSNLTISGAFTVYFIIVLYCLVLLWFFLPETKDRTLQDIEEEFRGKSKSDEEIKLKILLIPDSAKNKIDSFPIR